MIEILEKLVAEMKAGTWTELDGACLIFRSKDSDILTVCNYLNGKIDPNKTVFRELASNSY